MTGRGTREKWERAATQVSRSLPACAALGDLWLPRSSTLGDLVIDDPHDHLHGDVLQPDLV